MATSDSDFLNSLSESQLATLLASHPTTASLLTEPPKDERQSQRELMARKRAAERDIKIPTPKDPGRRLKCMADPELFLRTYFPDEFYEEFTDDRRAMLGSFLHAAKYGGDQAVAGPRGEGKTALAIKGALYLMVCGLSDFPVVIGKNQTKSQLELKALRERLQQAELFRDDFPEIGVPFEAVGAWSSRARMQTVAGRNTNMVLAVDHIAFPTISREQLPPHWPSEVEPVSCGQVIYCLGIDGPIRGTKFRGKRPTLAIIDDIEDREAAESDAIITKNEEVIEKDIAGLGSGAERVARVFLCTLQNRKCIAFRYTDPKQKPSFKGKRYRKMVRPPNRTDLVEQYVEMRREKPDEDPDARIAHRFWRENQEDIERGCVISNPSSYSKKTHQDGDPLEWSAIQAYYNRVADWGKDAVATEIDNDPPETVGPQGMGLTADVVRSRLSGLAKQQAPANTQTITAAIDLGKYRCHWVVTAWWKGAGGCVIDYGVAEVTGTSTDVDNDASEPHIYRTLLDWRDSLLSKHYTDASGTNRPVDMVLVDSGTFTNAAYEFVRQVSGVFHAAKGIGRYRRKTESNKKIRAGSNMHAAYQPAQGLWLYELDTDYWKQWVHERFLTPTFDDQNMLRRGSLSLWTPEGNQKHTSYAQHIVSEELVTEFKEGKGAKTFWDKRNDNNHWLDATYMAAACTEAMGVAILDPDASPKVEPRERQPKERQTRPRQKPHGRFRTRPGGWINGIRRRT